MAGKITDTLNHEPQASGSDKDAGTARSNLQQAALTFYQCKDGSLVNNPRDCYNLNLAPELEITNNTES